MKTWIPYPTTLYGHIVDLYSLHQDHFDDLLTLAKEKKIWEHYIYDGSDPVLLEGILTAALVERERGTQYPFVIFHKGDQKIIGSTRFLDLQYKHRKLEIGTTWIHPDYWGTAVNLECKYVLLTYCFEVLQTLRVQLKTDENNIRSRKAIEKIGGQFEGILRNDMLRANNTRRHSACYSLIEQEWEANKIKLSALLLDKMNQS